MNKEDNIHRLARAGEEDEVKRLFDIGEDIIKSDVDGCWTVLLIAAVEGKRFVVTLLVLVYCGTDGFPQLHL